MREKKTESGKKIVLMGARLSENFGGPSLFVSTKMTLDTVFPDAEYTLFVPRRRNYELEMKLASRYNVRVIPCITTKLFFLALLRKWTRVLIGSALDKATIKALEESDVIIDITGIIFADTLGLNTFHNRICGGSKFILGKIFNKPIIKYTVSAGPFNYKWNRIFARLYLRYFIDLILARDEITYQNVKALDVKTPILVIPDTAFLLQSYESKESKRYATLRKEKLLIGLSVSHQVQNRVSAPTNYITIMEEFVNYLIAKYHVRVVVIPNESGDTRIAAQICEKVADSCCEVLCVDSLLAQEIKGVINQCDVIIAARYHTIVAALSLGIPTLAIGWHHKYVGVLELFEQEDRLCDISDLTFEGLVSKFEDLWEDRVMIRETIIHSLPTVRKRTMKGAEEVHNHYVSFSRHPNHTSFLAATAFALIVLIYSRIINTFRLVVFRGR